MHIDIMFVWYLKPSCTMLLPSRYFGWDQFKNGGNIGYCIYNIGTNKREQFNVMFLLEQAIDMTP